MILDQIIAAKQQQLQLEMETTPQADLMTQLDEIEYCPTSFRHALLGQEKLAIIAEVKKASPSKGVIKVDFNPVAIAQEYAQNQVAAISVLTESQFFLGSNAYLREIRSSVRLPLLRKDFIIHPYQVYQSRLLGADCILLIVAVLQKQRLQELLQLAKSIALQCLVEVHNHRELMVALECQAEMIGINNRNLQTFVTELQTTEQLMQEMPKNQVVVSESGIHTLKDLMYLQSIGVHGVLIGESLMRSPSITHKLMELRGENIGES